MPRTAGAITLALPVFFLSGVAALVYQVVWQRILIVFSGGDVYSATLVVGAFMAGLGFGHLGGGHLADRVSARRSLVLFGVAELGIAAFGLVSDLLYYNVLYQRFGHLDVGPALTTVVLFAGLLLPTCFMGASLPLLSRALATRLDRAAATIGWLYSLNTLGAAAGALAATWWLMPRLGLSGALEVAAALNFICALGVVPLGRALARESAAPAAPAAQALPVNSGNTGAVPDRFRFPAWVVIYALAGMIALSLEIVWFRLLGVMVKSSAFTFGTLLALYLGGLGLGGIAGSLAASRWRRPAAAFLVLQAAAGLSAGLLLLALMARVQGVERLQAHFASFEPMDLGSHLAGLRGLLFEGEWGGLAEAQFFLQMYVWLPLLITFVPTFLMGCSFPVLQRVVQTDLAMVGRRVGVLLLGNIVGSLAGAFLTGLVLLDLLGTAGTLRLLVGLSSIFLVLAFGRAGWSWRMPHLRLAAGAVVAALLVSPLLVAMPSAQALWASLHGTEAARMIAAEDGSGVSAILLPREGNEAYVFVNGLGQSQVPFVDIHAALGAVPAFVHGAPRTAAIIGLGSGATAYNMAGHPSIRRIVCIEINRPQLTTLRRLSDRLDYPALSDLLRDPRIEHVFGDGRRYLMRTAERFDLIEADALRPTSAYAGNLYSEEYFELLRSRLHPNGLAVAWRATGRVQETFLRVFPYVVILSEMLLGSNEPIEIDWNRLAAQLSDPAVTAYFQRANIDIGGIVLSRLDSPELHGPDSPRPPAGNANRDLYPRDEFFIQH